MGIQDVTDPASGQRAKSAELRVAINLPIVRRVDPLHGVVIPVLTNEHTGLAALQSAGRDARMLQRLPADFHDQALLGVKTLCLAG